MANNKPKTLDSTDLAIVRALQENARLSNKELAAKVHLAPSSCLERARRLKESGVLERFCTRVDPSAVGIGLQAMISIKLGGHTRENYDAFRQHALGCPEVVALYHVTGANDFLIHIAVRDAEHLRRLIVEDLSGHAEIERLETSMILEETTRPLPIFNGASAEAPQVRSSPRPLAFRAAGS
ncbi:MAG: Lrp/AsnC family transcriptional regulator [Acidobacteriota bacterium]